MSRILFTLCLLALTSPAATLLRLQCAGPAGVDASGNAWQADGYFLGGARWDASNQPAMAAQPVPYRSLRYAVGFSYTLPVPAPGNYVVTLKMIEPNKTAAGQRVFSILLNGKVVAPAFDLFAVAGALTPRDLAFPVTTATGQIRIDLAAGAGNAVLSAIQIDDVAASAEFIPGPGILFDFDPSRRTIIRLDPVGLAFRPWISPVFPGPDSAITILGADHGISYFPNCAVVVEVWDASDPQKIHRITADVIAEDTISIDRKACDVDIAFKAPRSQYFVVVR